MRLCSRCSMKSSQRSGTDYRDLKFTVVRGLSGNGQTWPATVLRALPLKVILSKDAFGDEGEVVGATQPTRTAIRLS